MNADGIARDEALRVGNSAAAELDRIVHDLERWIGLDTPGGDLAALDAFAGGLASTLAGYGLAPERVPTRAGDVVHATLDGGGTAHVVLLCHHDTVYPAGTAAARPFVVSGARARGPGVADMKGGIAVAAHAARLLAAGPRPFGRLEIVSVPDEESRPGAPLTLDRFAGCDAVLCLECGRTGGEIVTARKGALWFRLRAEGRASHAGEAPGLGRNVAHALAHIAVALSSLHGGRDGLTVQVTGLQAGEGLNTVPSSGLLTGDVRALEAADLEWVWSRIAETAAHEGVATELEDLGGPPPFERSDATGRLAAAAAELAGALGISLGEAVAGGVSDGSWTASRGIPTLDGLGPVGGLDHSPDEYIEVASLASRCGLVAGLVAAVDGGLLG